jgi:hypothetical protein
MLSDAKKVSQQQLQHAATHQRATSEKLNEEVKIVALEQLMKKLVQKLNGVDQDSRVMLEELEIIRRIMSSQLPILYQGLEDM